MAGLFFLSLGTDVAMMPGIAAGAMFLNVLFFAALGITLQAELDAYQDGQELVALAEEWL